MALLVPGGRPLRSCEPRDLIDRARDVCSFAGQPLALSEEALDLAWTGTSASATPSGGRRPPTSSVQGAPKRSPCPCRIAWRRRLTLAASIAPCSTSARLARDVANRESLDASLISLAAFFSYWRLHSSVLARTGCGGDGRSCARLDRASLVRICEPPRRGGSSDGGSHENHAERCLEFGRSAVRRPPNGRCSRWLARIALWAACTRTDRVSVRFLRLGLADAPGLAAPNAHGCACACGAAQEVPAGIAAGADDAAEASDG